MFRKLISFQLLFCALLSAGIHLPATANAQEPLDTRLIDSWVAVQAALPADIRASLTNASEETDSDSHPAIIAPQIIPQFDLPAARPRVGSSRVCNCALTPQQARAPPSHR